MKTPAKTSARGSSKKPGLRGTTTNVLNVENMGNGKYNLVLSDDTGELASWPFTAFANNDIVSAMHLMGQFMAGGQTQLFDQLYRIIDLEIEEGQTLEEVYTAMGQVAFNSEEFLFLGDSIFAVTGDEVLLDCLAALGAVLVAM